MKRIHVMIFTTLPPESLAAVAGALLNPQG
nr:MAG TPA_asm: hypothetical protein [Caudoviricetes sp.]